MSHKSQALARGRRLDESAQRPDNEKVSVDLFFRIILPLSRVCSPIHIEKRVVLPQPFGPKTPTHSPGKTFNDSFLRTGLPLKDLLISLTSKIGLSFLNFNILKAFFICF